MATLPEASTTVHVTVVVPNGNATGASLVTLATAQLSFVTGVPNTTPVKVHPLVNTSLTATGAVMVGKIKSVTVTVAVPVAELPFVSVTVNVTVLPPNSSHVKVSGDTLMLAI